MPRLRTVRTVPLTVRCSLFAVPNSARTHAWKARPAARARSSDSLFTVRCSLFTVRNTERAHTPAEGRRCQIACGARVRCSEFAVRSSLFRTVSARTRRGRREEAGGERDSLSSQSSAPTRGGASGGDELRQQTLAHGSLARAAGGGRPGAEPQRGSHDGVHSVEEHRWSSAQPFQKRQPPVLAKGAAARCSLRAAPSPGRWAEASRSRKRSEDPTTKRGLQPLSWRCASPAGCHQKSERQRQRQTSTVESIARG